MILMVVDIGVLQVDSPDRLLKTKNGIEFVVSKVDDLVNWARKYVFPSTELKWTCFARSSDLVLTLKLPLRVVSGDLFGR